MRRAGRGAGRVIVVVLIAALAGCDTGSAPQGMVKIPAGSFPMGSDKVDTEGKGNEFGMAKPLYQDEHPRREINLPTYYIDRYETTNAEYGRYVEATKARPPKTWPDGRVPAGRERLPVTNVNWYEAEQYCQWAGKRLPTEAEWEKAARGADGRRYPWGNEAPDATRARFAAAYNATVPVGSHAQGASPYGVLDMAGNVWQWTSSLYRPYPYRAGDGREDARSPEIRATRGGAHDWPAEGITATHRGGGLSRSPAAGHHNIGFRCAR